MAACGSTSGAKLNPESVNQLVKGQTTIDQATTLLGKPNSKTQMGNGETMIQYIYVNTSVRGATYIPFVGALAGGADVQIESTSLTFDKNGILKDVMRRESTQGSSLGGGN